MEDPKKIAAMIVARKAPEAPMVDAADDGDGNGEGQHAAASEMMDAIKSGDASALAAALKNFIEMC